MREKLEEINSIKGVWGYVLCDNTGKILEKEMPIVFMKHLAMMGKEVTQVVGLLETLSKGSENLDLLFEDGRVMIRSLKNFTLVVFCDPNVDIPMLRLKTNVVVSEITGNPKMQELLQKGEWRRRRLLQKEHLSEEYREILSQLVPEDAKPDTSA
jgi:predicted regulator of Ras-like GTPase activity (Roadblock/LC7/MglB family)